MDSVRIPIIGRPRPLPGQRHARPTTPSFAKSQERVHRTSYPTRDRAIKDIARWIELRYNQKRLHSALGYRTPNEAEQEWYRNHSAA